MKTLKDIANECSVSIATVSNILNNKSNVSKETKDRVLKVIKESGYKPNYMARGLRATKTNTIGLLIDDLTQFSTPMLVDGIMAYLEANNYKSVIENLRFFSKWKDKWEGNPAYNNAVASSIQQFDAIKVDGIIYVASHCRNIDSLPKNNDIPTAICYAFSKENPIPSVMINDEKAACEMTEYLIKKGHSNIAVISGSKDNIHTEKRLLGFKNTLSKNNISFNSKLICYGDWSFDGGYNACKELFKTNQKFTAIFCFNDLMAAGVYKYLREINLEPGEDISVAGFDNRFEESFLRPKLTTMQIPLFNIGKKSAEIILKKIQQQDLDNNELYIDCTFIEGESVKGG